MIIPVRGQFNMLFTSDYDLPNSLVNEITEDSYGMMWIATEDGLCRYNGSRFITYRNIPGDECSLNSSFVRCVCTDNRGNVIIGGITGLQIYNRKTDNFSPRISTESIGLPTSNINDICLLKNGDFAVVGVNSFNIHIDDDGNYKLMRNALSSKNENGLHIMEDSHARLWAAYGAKGIWRADSKGRVTNIKAADGSQYDFAVLTCGSDGKVFAGHIAGGLYCYNERTGHFDFLQGTESLKKIRDVKQVPQTTMLCVGTDGGGVHMYDVKKHSFVNSRFFDDPFIDLSTQKAHSLFINKTGDIWVALYQKGIYLSPKNVSSFGYVGARSQKYNLIGDRCVTSLVQRCDGTIWVATDNGGLYGMTPDMQAIRSFAYNDSNGLPASLLGLFEDSKGRLWFGSYNHAGGVFDVNSGNCHYVRHKDVQGHLYSIFGYVEDKRGQIWAASMGNGILRYNEAMDQMETYVESDGTAWTNSIYYDREKDIVYCGTYDGVVWFNPLDKTRKTHQLDMTSVVYCISKLSKNTIGFGTTDGLVILNTETGKLHSITTKDGLANSNIFAMQPGTDGDIWMSSGGGLIRYDSKANAVETFNAKDGLQGNEFYKNASLTSKDGRLWFGGVNGITVFAPEKIKSSKDLKITSQVVSIRAGEHYLGIDETGYYTIPSGVDVFNVELATLPLYMSHRVTYYYKMDNGDWEMLPMPQNRVLFDNISCGCHTLYTKASIDGVESEVTETCIYIMYPWYLRWWANLIWFVIIAVAAYYTHLFVKRRRTMKEDLLQHKHEEEIKEGKLQFFMNVVHDLRTPLTLIETPLQKLRGMGDDDQHKRLYDIMSRNTDRLLKLTNEIMDLRKLDRGKMQLFPHNTFVSKHVNEISNAMSDMVNTRHQQLVLTDHTDGRQMMCLDAMAFDKILTNLLSNAIKYTSEGGQIEVEWDVVENLGQHPLTVNNEQLTINNCSSINNEQLTINNYDYQKTEVEGNSQHPTPNTQHPTPNTQHPTSNTQHLTPTLVLSVTDNGIGISDEDKKRIFERFYQVRINDKHIKGTGIGLNLVHSLVELHNGEITVSDNPNGKGTRFTIVIPNQTAVLDVEQSITPDKDMVEDDACEDNVAMTDEATKTSGPKRTLLIVDDDDDIRTFLSVEMAALFNILEASNGKIAFDILNQEKVDIVVSDVMMPEVDGIELTRKIRENVRLSNLPIILLTAKASDQDRLEGLQATADAYVTKPFNLELLQTIIINILVRNDKLQNSYKGNVLPADRIDTPEIQSADDKLMERLLRVLNDNLSNPDLTTDFLAQEVGLSRGHLYRKLKELTNQSATNFVRNIRLTKAAELLRQKHCTVAEVAYLVGFRTPTHFSTAFKELYGMTPREYMNKENEK